MNIRTFTILLFLPILMLVIFSTELYASEPVDNVASNSVLLQVLSISPSTGSLTAIEASGTWRNSCVPELESFEFIENGREKNLLRIMAVAEQTGFACGHLESAWQFPVAVNFNMPGSYTVEFYVVSEQLGIIELHASQEIVIEGHLSVSPYRSQVDDSTILTVTGFQPDGCIPEYVSHENVEGTIVVEIVTPDSAMQVCGQVLTPWQIGLEMEALDDGQYVVEVYRSEEHQGSPTNRELYKRDSLSIGVGGAQVVEHFIYLPSIVSK